MFWVVMEGINMNIVIVFIVVVDLVGKLCIVIVIGGFVNLEVWW